jgi:hypothetical protein
VGSRVGGLANLERLVQTQPGSCARPGPDAGLRRAGPERRFSEVASNFPFGCELPMLNGRAGRVLTAAIPRGASPSAFLPWRPALDFTRSGHAGRFGSANAEYARASGYA